LKLDLIGLYGRFIERKYDFFEEKSCQVSPNNVCAIEQKGRDIKSMRKDHQLLALNVLFNQETVALFLHNKQGTCSAEELESIGIVQVSEEGIPHLIHCIFAEYYVANFFVNQLNKKTNSFTQLQQYLLEGILLKSEYRVVRVFIDGLL
jgi:hypothetical protein